MTEELSLNLSGLKRSCPSIASKTDDDIQRLFNDCTHEGADFGSYASQSLKQLRFLLDAVTTAANRSSSSSSNNTISSTHGAVPEPSTQSSNRNSSTSSASASNSSASASASSSRQNLTAESNSGVLDDTGQCSRGILACLNELIELWRGVEPDDPSRNFVELLIVKKLNYLSNSVLGIERRIVPVFINSNNSADLLSMNESYARYDRLEADLGPDRLVRISLNVPNLLTMRNLGNFKRNFLL